jgi:hypothetical protein
VSKANNVKKVKKTTAIRELRAKGMSVADVAKKLKVKPEYVYKVAWLDKNKNKNKKHKKHKKAKTVESDLVNHPPHYTAGGIETIDFIEAKQLSYGLGNVVKYISRCGKKSNEDPLESLKKAQFYLNREIQLRSKGD